MPAFPAPDVGKIQLPINPLGGRKAVSSSGALAYSEALERLAVNIAHCLDALLKSPPEDILITPEWICDMCDAD